MLDIHFNVDESRNKRELRIEKIEGLTPGGNKTVREIHYEVLKNPSTGELSRGQKINEYYQITKGNSEAIRLASDYKTGIEKLTCFSGSDPYDNVTRVFERKIGGSKIWNCTRYVDDAVTFDKHCKEFALHGEGVFDISKLPHPVRPAVAKAAVTKLPFLKGCAEFMKYASKFRI